MKIKIDTRNLNNLKADLSDVQRATPKATTRAINKTLRGVRTDSVKEIQNEITPKVSVIRKSMSIRWARGAQWSGSVSSRGEPLGLIHYAARQRAKGVSVRVEKNNPRYLVKSAFIKRIKGGRNVFRRDFYGGGSSRSGKKKGRKGKVIPYAKLDKKYRLPISRLTGPRIPDIMGKQRVLGKIEKNAAERMQKNLLHEMDWELEKLKRK